MAGALAQDGAGPARVPGTLSREANLSASRRVLVVGLLALLVAGGCQGAFPVRRAPIALGVASPKASLSVEGPEDMREWGILLREEMAKALSGAHAVDLVELEPGDILVRATIESWDFGDRTEDLVDPELRRKGLPPAYYRRRTALMEVEVEVSDPGTGDVLARRRYLGVEADTQDKPRDKFRSPAACMRQAAAKVAAQLVEDLAAAPAP